MSNSKIDFLLLIVVMIVVAIIGLARPFDKVSNIKDITVTVTDKVVKNGNDSGTYLIFGEDENGTIHTFEITDSLLRFRFNSSDVYAAIETGSKYEFTVGGYGTISYRGTLIFMSTNFCRRKSSV